jgi:thiamine-phosphate pyrophosphorylase
VKQGKKKIDFRLLVVTDRKSSNKGLVKILEDCCKYGVKAIQLREKDMQAGELVKLAKKMRTLTSKTKTKLMINDKLDAVLLSNAEGLHLPENGVDIKLLKKYKGLILGKSVHSLERARKADKEGYDYLLFGPVFRTPAKVKYGEPQGLDKLEKVCSSVNIPVFAVGGIIPARTKKCLEAGAHGIAVMGGIMKSANIKKTINGYKTELGGL